MCQDRELGAQKAPIKRAKTSMALRICRVNWNWFRANGRHGNRLTFFDFHQSPARATSIPHRHSWAEALAQMTETEFCATLFFQRGLCNRLYLFPMQPNMAWRGVIALLHKFNIERLRAAPHTPLTKHSELSRNENILRLSQNVMPFLPAASIHVSEWHIRRRAAVECCGAHVQI